MPQENKYQNTKSITKLIQEKVNCGGHDDAGTRRQVPFGLKPSGNPAR